jgi:hypothetical protein
VVWEDGGSNPASYPMLLAYPRSSLYKNISWMQTGAYRLSPQIFMVFALLFHGSKKRPPGEFREVLIEGIRSAGLPFPAPGIPAVRITALQIVVPDVNYSEATVISDIMDFN